MERRCDDISCERNETAPLIHAIQKEDTPRKPGQICNLNMASCMDRSWESDCEKNRARKCWTDLAKQDQPEQIHSPCADRITCKNDEMVCQKRIPGHFINRQPGQCLSKQVIRSCNTGMCRIESITIPNRHRVLWQRSPLPGQSPEIQSTVCREDSSSPLLWRNDVDQEQRRKQCQQ